MRLKTGLGKTVFAPPRGYGEASTPKTGAQALPSSFFRTLEDVREEARHGGELAYRPGRVFLGRIDGQMIGLEDNRHIVTVAGSRSGKSACALIPNLLLYPGSALVIDPKGELAEATARHRADTLKQRVVVLDPFGIVKGEAVAYRQRHDLLSELDLPQTLDDETDLIDDAALLAEALVVETGGDAHWTIAARNLITSLILLVRLYPDRLPWIHDALSGDPAPLWDLMANYGLGLDEQPGTVTDACAIIRAQGESFRHKNDREAPGIVSSALEQLAFLQSPKLRRFLDGDEARLRDLIAGSDDQPTTIYLVLPAGRMGTHNRWLRAIVTLALNHFERSAKAPAIPVLMILEEFAALEFLRPIERAAGFIAGAGVRLWVVLQDLSQLKTHYKDGWETFIGNAGVIQAFSLSDLTTCKYLSDRLGETTVTTVVTDEQMVGEYLTGRPATRHEFRTVPLLSPSEIALTFARKSVGGQAAGGLTLVMTPDGRPLVVDRVYWKDDMEPAT